MRNLVVAALALVLLGLAPLAAGADQTGLAQVEHAIKAKLDAGPLGDVTRDVRCVEVDVAETSCTVTSVTGTERRALLIETGDGYQLMWEPLEG